jgi:hypothetical protein
MFVMASIRGIGARTAAVGLLAGAVVSLAATPVLAATGTITILPPDGTAVSVRNPAPGCLTLAKQLPANTAVQNRTNSRIILYTQPSCSGDWARSVPPGGTANAPVRSIQVIS